MRSLEDKREGLIIQLESTRARLDTLESAEQDIQAMKEQVETHRDVLAESLGEEEKGRQRGSVFLLGAGGWERGGKRGRGMGNGLGGRGIGNGGEGHREWGEG